MTPPRGDRVSVVIPTYNRAAFLPLTIESVLAQSHAPIEVIVIDDGSTDDTAARCARLPAPVRYVRQENAGVSVARNHGARLATGDWLAFVDSDDLWHRDKLRIQLAALQRHPQATWSCTGCDVIDVQGRPIEARRGFTGVFAVFGYEQIAPAALFREHLVEEPLPVGDARYTLFVGDAWPPLFLGNFVLPSSAIIRRDAFAQVGGFDPAFRLAEETEFFHRLSATNPVALITEPLVLYRAGQDGSLISPANIPTLMENALTSIDRAFQLRAVRDAAAPLYRRGRRRLLRRIAFARFTRRDGPGTRVALERYRRAEGVDVWAAALWAGSWLPKAAIDMLHRVKRVERR